MWPFLPTELKAKAASTQAVRRPFGAKEGGMVALQRPSKSRRSRSTESSWGTKRHSEDGPQPLGPIS